MSFFRRSDDAESGVGPPVPRPSPEEAAQARRSGRIVSPRAGETVSDVVEVEVDVPGLPGGVDRVEVEYSADGERWRDLGAVQDEPYDLRAVLEDGAEPVHVAVVRSWRLAQFFRLVLEGQPELFRSVEVESSDATPWPEARGGQAWNTNGLGDGRYRLRATTVASGGERATTAEIEVVVDNAGPDVELVGPQPDAVLEGTVALRAEAHDTGSSVRRVVFEASLDGSDWEEVAAAAEEPWEAEWTLEGSAAEVALRARAIDRSGNEQLSAVVTCAASRAALEIELGPLPDSLRGRLDLSAHVEPAAAVQEVDFQLREEGGAWLTVASAIEPPFAGTFDSTVLADGAYEARVLVRPRAGEPTASEPRSHRVDNTPPTVRLDVPDDGFVAGTVALVGRAHDEGSGLATLEIDLRPEDCPWQDLARVEGEPVLEHRWDTTAVPDGSYDLRVKARDRAGNERTPELVAVVVDNEPPGVALVSPTADDTLTGIVALEAEVADPASGIAWVRHEWSSDGEEWHELPRDADGVLWQTAEVTDGQYRLRVRAADRAGNVGVSSPVRVRVENELEVPEDELEQLDEVAAEPAEDTEESPTRFGPVPAWLETEPGEEEPELEAEPEPEPEPEPPTLVPVPEPETLPEREPEPEPELEPAAHEELAPTVVAFPRGSRSWDLWELDRLVEEHADDDPLATEERRAVLYYLRDHAALDGSIPDGFEAVVQETFGDLL